ncbi:MAG: hypothetical protein FJZ64_04805 [Chlamydiae bacterium]|nr:hypothetical protein [Chlamydiota bacterium]
MEDEKYEALRETLVKMLKELEKVKKTSDFALILSKKIGAPLEKEMKAFSLKFDSLMHELLKLEQETRAI